MTKKRRPGTRGGGRGRLPSDIADAAEAALDDMLQRAPESGDDDEPKTQTRSPSHEVPVAAIDDGDEEMQTVDAHRVEPPSDDTAAVTGRRSKIPLPAPPRTTSVHTLGSLVPRESSPPSTPPPRASPPLGSRAATPPVSRPATPVSRATPTPPLVRGSPAVSSPQTPTPTPVIPRPRTAVNLGHSPQTPLEPTTADLGPLEGSFDQTARLPPDLPLDLDGLDGADIPDPDELVPVRPELASLQVAVYEDAAHLASAQGAIVAAGHVVDVGASGRDGIGRVLAAVRGGSIDVVLVALPGGEAIVEAALALEPRRPIVIASFAGRAIDAVARAHAAGADLAVVRPHDVERLAPILLAAARLHVEKGVALAARGNEQVLRARLDEIVDPEPRGLLPFEMFQRVLELEIRRAKRFEYSLSVALFAVEVAPPPPPPGIRGILRARAGNVLIHAIRDIDIATQLDHERFLVLLPYTDLKGAAQLGRRVIGAVGQGDPVVAVGRTFPPRLVGAVAGGAPGQTISFAKLMKDATRALEQARRDGAELAVQP